MSNPTAAGQLTDESASSRSNNLAEAVTTLAEVIKNQGQDIKTLADVTKNQGQELSEKLLTVYEKTMDEAVAIRGELSTQVVEIHSKINTEATAIRGEIKTVHDKMSTQVVAIYDQMKTNHLAYNKKFETLAGYMETLAQLENMESTSPTLKWSPSITPRQSSIILANLPTSRR